MPPQVVFFDAAGTLIHLREPVGEAYGRIAAGFGVQVEPAAITPAFRQAWKALPAPVHEGPPDDDDRGWWQALVGRTFATAVGRPLAAEVLGPLFDALYRHYADPGAWDLFDDVQPALEHFGRRCRLLVLSNFDRRLRAILAGHGIAHHFEAMIISSEVGASKPHPRIFQAALARAGARAEDCLHIGDDEKADVGGAEGQGMRAHLVRRPGAGLMDLAEKLFPG
jgi:putative hydrolase of the HAD superfamily